MRPVFERVLLPTMRAGAILDAVVMSRIHRAAARAEKLGAIALRQWPTHRTTTTLNATRLHTAPRQNTRRQVAQPISHTRPRQRFA